MTSQCGNEQKIDTCYGFDSVSFTGIKPLYELKGDGTLIGKSSLLVL
jgi:hypothetical protein